MESQGNPLWVPVPEGNIGHIRVRHAAGPQGAHISNQHQGRLGLHSVAPHGHKGYAGIWMQFANQGCLP